MIPFQLQLESTLASFHQLAVMMQLRWSWPFAESAHFIGLTLLFGSIAAWDLRLMGFLPHVPVTAFHRFIPFAVTGFAINMTSGFLFLVTYPDQYVYNSAFHLKMLCVLLAGGNVAVFYLTTFRQTVALPVGARLPRRARFAGALSITLWLTVIVCGRMITFYRPALCEGRGVAGFIANCVVR